MRLPVYLDYHATTPVDPRVLEAMLPWFTAEFGNAASRTHVYGQRAAEAVEQARSQVAALIGAEPKEVVFTSGATESINLALAGAFEAARQGVGPHAGRDGLVTLPTEHKATLDTVRVLQGKGARVTIVPVGEEGLIRMDRLEEVLTPGTLLVSVLMANNEIGVLQPVGEIARRAEAAGALVHVDAAQALGRLPLDVRLEGMDLLSMSAHKIYGPKGVGALFVRRRTPRIRLAEQIHGGGHERGLRSGTLNVPGIVGFGEACALAARELEQEARRTGALRDRLLERLRLELGPEGFRVNGALEPRLPNNLNVSFRGVEGESLIMGMRDVAVSSGSACTSASAEPSHVLAALGLTPDEAHSSIRFGLGRFTTEEEIDYAAARVVETVRWLRARAPGAVSGD